MLRLYYCQKGREEERKLSQGHKQNLGGGREAEGKK